MMIITQRLLRRRQCVVIWPLSSNARLPAVSSTSIKLYAFMPPMLFSATGWQIGSGPITGIGGSALTHGMAPPACVFNTRWQVDIEAIPSELCFGWLACWLGWRGFLVPVNRGFRCGLRWAGRLRCYSQTAVAANPPS